MEADICWFFSRNGWCRYGNLCKYRHQRIQSPQYYPNYNYSYYYNVPNYYPFPPSTAYPRPFQQQQQQHPRPHVRTQVWRRRNYGANKRGPKLEPNSSDDQAQGHGHEHERDEAMGTLCHQVANMNVEVTTTVDDQSQDDQVAVVIEPTLVQSEQIESTPLKEITEEELLKKSRETEVSQLKKRFPACKVLDEDNDSSFSLQISATDPDWPFSVNDVHLIVNIPAAYPAEVLRISVPCDLNAAFPSPLTRHLNVSIENWIQENHQKNMSSGKSELLFRPFLKWFDRNLIDLFTNGLRKTKLDMTAKAVGLEFVPYEQLLPSLTESDSEKVKEVQEPQSEVNNIGEDGDGGDTAPEGETTASSQRGPRRQDTSSAPKGTEMKFRLFEINENVGTMKCQTLAMTVQCCKCKSRHDITAAPKRVNAVKCTTCSQQLKLVFRPCLMHQFSAVVGYLDLDVCRPFDLILFNCSFLVDCMVCNKQITVDGVHYGQIRTNWCHYCNAKMTFKIENVKFTTHRQASAIAGKEHVIKLEKIRKVKDPAIQEGKPLPDNGACKHYKKSFRWFRFPCCGKAYPCDLCHEENETGHEMKFANRIICGFCANEQPYARDRPCARCATSLTKKSGSYWEGGKGCREKIKMSRDDKHKYAGINKTVPKKVIR